VDNPGNSSQETPVYRLVQPAAGDTINLSVDMDDRSGGDYIRVEGASNPVGTVGSDYTWLTLRRVFGETEDV
jgi:hypothetical protein